MVSAFAGAALLGAAAFLFARSKGGSVVSENNVITSKDLIPFTTTTAEIETAKSFFNTEISQIEKAIQALKFSIGPETAAILGGGSGADIFLINRRKSVDPQIVMLQEQLTLLSAGKESI